MKRKYRVILRVDIDGKSYQFGDVVELNLKAAVEHSYALIAWEGESDGGHS